MEFYLRYQIIIQAIKCFKIRIFEVYALYHGVVNLKNKNKQV